MKSRASQSREISRAIAFCGMAVALSVVLVLLGSLLQIGLYAAPLFAGILLLFVRLEFDSRYAWSVWAASTLLLLLLCPDREAAFYYGFVGWWPIVKWSVDLHIRSRAVRSLVKLAVFAAAITAMYLLLVHVLHLISVDAEFQGLGLWGAVLFYGLNVLCLMVWDRLLTPLSLIWTQRIRPKLTFLNRK